MNLMQNFYGMLPFADKALRRLTTFKAIPHSNANSERTIPTWMSIN